MRASSASSGSGSTHTGLGGMGPATRYTPPDPLRPAVVVLVAERVAERFHRVAAVDAIAHEMDEVVDLAQLELAVATEERHRDPSERPTAERFGVVDHRRQRRRIRSRGSSRPVPGRRWPQHSVDVAGLCQYGPPPLDQLTGLPIERIELFDDDLAFPVECVAMGEREAGVDSGERPLVVLGPSRCGGQRPIRSCVHGTPPQL